MREVVALDGCKGGWIAASLDDPELIRSFRSLENAAEHYGDGAVYYIDAPIGLADAPLRCADMEASKCCGQGTVFPSPGLQVIQALQEHGFDEKLARELQYQIYDKRMLKQTANIIRNIMAAREQRARMGSDTVREYHPEVSFSCLSGVIYARDYSKHKPLGQIKRWQILHDHLNETQLRKLLRSKHVEDATDACIGAVCGKLIEEQPNSIRRFGLGEEVGIIWAWGSRDGLKKVEKASDEDVEMLLELLRTFHGMGK